MHKSLELLAPAKDINTGIAAIMHGADAVYIAADKFGAREKAGNSINDIKILVDFAHQYFARIYVTVNTILFENELDEAKKLIDSLYSINVDAIIIQDFAILDMDIPPIAIHASTQMHNNTHEKITFLENLGVERVVLPRELSVQEIKSFKENTGVELECFIHGALCVSYSGQCYMSQAITGRSANRGACAQPCRSSYDLIDVDGNVLVKNKHLLSLKDLNLSQYIDQLIDAGVSSFKIEGRMKDISYVKNTTAFYSSIINNLIKNNPNYKRLSSGRCEYKFIPDPERSFNRGFTSHFIEGRAKNQASFNSQKSIGKLIGKVVKKSENWFTIDSTEPINNGDGLCYFNSKGELNGFQVNSSIQGKITPNQLQETLDVGTIIYRNADRAFEKLLNTESSTRLVAVSIAVEQKNNQFIFTAIDEDLISSSLLIDDTFDNSQNPQLALNNFINTINKSGGTIFKIENINIIAISNPKHIPIATLNGIRRELLANLIKNRLSAYQPNKRKPSSLLIKYPISQIDYRGNIANSKSRDFLISTGVEKIDDAFEIKQPKGDVELMVTRYCIKYELNLCPSKQNAKPTKQLFLRDNKYTYPLEFDCNHCQMKVIKPKNINK